MMGLFSSHMVVLLFLYFIQGLPYGLQARFLPVYLRSRGVSLTNIGLFKILLAPWFCKALWAPLVDKYGTKQKWLLGSICGLMVTCAVISFILPDQLMLLCFLILALNISSATQDIAVDGIALAILTKEELGQGNTVQVVGYKIGAIFSGGILVWFMDTLGWMGLFLVLTVLYVEALLLVYLSPSLRNLHSEKKEGQYDKTSSSSVSKLDVYDEDVLDLSEQTCETTDISPAGSGKQTPPGQGMPFRANQRHEEHVVKGCHDDHVDGTDVDGDEVCDDTESQIEPLTVESLAVKHKNELTSYKTRHSEKSNFIREVLDVPRTRWMMVYVLIYKLGRYHSIIFGEYTKNILFLFLIFLMSHVMNS